MQIKTTQLTAPCLALLLALPAAGHRAQAPAPSAQTSAPHQSGTVKTLTPNGFVLATASGADATVTVPAAARILLVDPATHEIKTARPGTIADIADGDKAIVTGTPGDTAAALTATRIYVLKSTAIAALHAGEQAAWAHSLGGIVRSVDPATGTLTLANGSRTYTVTTTPATLVRRYAAGSVNFADAVKSTVAAIQPGDQVQARGPRSADGLTLTADEIVSGSFSNFSGLLTAVDPAANTVTLKDLATKKTVTVALTPQTNLRKLPAGMGSGAAAANSGQTPTAAAPARSQTSPGAPAGASRRPDLARLINRLPAQTPADLKPGEAVMIVASNNPETGRPTAITLLSGVEQILATSPTGQTPTLSPWSLNSGEGEAGGGESGGGGGGAPGR